MTGEHMRNKLAGVSLMGLIVVLIILAVIALFAMKVIPSYMEYRGMKNAIQAIAREKPNGTPAEIRKSFEARSNIDDFTSVRPQDLEVSKGSISFAYRKEVPLWTGVALVIDYAATTAQ
jgi:Tfp pilus assembly protein PilE